MLNSHPNIAIPYETHFLTNYIKTIDSYQPLEDDSNLDCLITDMLGEELLQQWDVVPTTEEVRARLTERTLAGVIDAIYSHYATAHGKRRWGDKSDYLNRMYEINRVFPKTKFIHIIRDGRDVAKSVMKMTWGPDDVIAAAEWWREYVRLGRCTGRMLPEDRYMEIRYEDLVLEPEGSLRKICSFLDEDYSEQMLSFYKDSSSLIPESRKSQHYNADVPPQASRTYAWKKGMSKTDIALFDMYAKEQLDDFGYEVDTVKLPGWRIKLAKITVMLRRII
jgi:hypothetical protein